MKSHVQQIVEHVSILKFAQRTKQLFSTFSRVECEYVRVTWCCYQIWSFCNVDKYIFQFVFWSNGFFFVVSTIFSLFVLFCSSWSTRVFERDKFFVLFSFARINCNVKSWYFQSNACYKAFWNFTSLNDHQKRDRKKQTKKIKNQIRKWKIRTSIWTWSRK